MIDILALRYNNNGYTQAGLLTRGSLHSEGEAAILRIVAGKYGGRYIKAPGGAATRPTAQNVREALFNIIASQVPGAVFIDLFAGSGAVGIEALSRGARAAVFAERDRMRVRIIKDNLANLGIKDEQAPVFALDLTQASAFDTLKSGLGRLDAEAAGIIFADPPYDLAGLCELPGRILESAICAAGGAIIVEHRNKTDMPRNAGISTDGTAGWALAQVRKYGDTCLSFYCGTNAINTEVGGNGR